MDSLRQLSQCQGIKTSQHSAPAFHSAFLASIKRYGRVHETEMVISYSLKDVGLPGLLKLAGLGFTMFRKGKIKLMPSRVRAIKHIRKLFTKAEGSTIC